jgi:hypothetical protein
MPADGELKTRRMWRSRSFAAVGQLLDLAARLLGGAGFELCVDLALLLEQRVTACVDQRAFGARAACE